MENNQYLLCKELIDLSKQVGLDQSGLASLMSLTQPYLSLLINANRPITARLIRLFEETINFLKYQIEINDIIHQEPYENSQEFSTRKKTFLQHLKYKFDLIPRTD